MSVFLSPFLLSYIPNFIIGLMFKISNLFLPDLIGIEYNVAQIFFIGTGG